MVNDNLQGPPDRSKNTGELIGRWMIYATWVLLIIMLTFLFSRWLEQQQNPNRHLLESASSEDDAELTLLRNRMGHYVAPGYINGAPVVFLLDTGATHVALSEELANELGLIRGHVATSMTANGLVQGWMTELDRVQLGPFSMSGIRATIMPSMQGSEVLLGMNFLKHLEMMQKGGKLILRMPVQS